jgi:hypothetical protein
VSEINVAQPALSQGSATLPAWDNFRRVYQRAVARAGHDLAAVDPHGPHDLRHTFSTWLEDAGIPARVIDELMGHERSRRGDLEGGSRIGARYRHTTPEMAVRVAAVIPASARGRGPGGGSGPRDGRLRRTRVLDPTEKCDASSLTVVC